MPPKKTTIKKQAEKAENSAEMPPEEIPGGPHAPQGQRASTGDEPYPEGHPRRPTGMTSAQRVIRNGLIVRRRAQGWPLRAIAAEAGVTERSVTNILKQAAQDKENGVSLLKEDPIKVIEWALEEHGRSFDAYSAVAADAPNDQVTLQALKAREQSLERIIRLLQATGKLPRELGTLRQIIDFRGIAQEMVKQLMAVRDGKASPEDAIEFFMQITGLGTENHPLLESYVGDAETIEEGEAA